MRILLALTIFVAGCGLYSDPVPFNPVNPEPTPTVNDIKAPAEAYWKQYAVWVEKGFLQSPQELAQNARQLQLVGLITTDEFNALDVEFPGCLKDAKPFADVKEAASKLRAMK